MTTPTPAPRQPGPPAGPERTTERQQDRQPDRQERPAERDQRRDDQRDERSEERDDDRSADRSDQRPPWEREGGEPFDPQRAWTQLQALRSERDRIREDRESLRQRVEEHDRSQMSESQRLEADRDGHRQRADTAEAQLVGLRAALSHGIPAADLEDFLELLGTGSAEQLQNRAERLAARFTPQRSGPPSARPQEAGRRRGGADPTEEPEERDLDKVAARMFNR